MIIAAVVTVVRYDNWGMAGIVVRGRRWRGLDGPAAPEILYGGAFTATRKRVA